MLTNGGSSSGLVFGLVVFSFALLTFVFAILGEPRLETTRVSIDPKDIPPADEHTTFLQGLISDRDPNGNPQPLIGILSQPLYHGLPNVSFIAASYVKFVEAAGATAVPIVYSDSKEEIIRRFKEVSGIILPGGTVGLDASSAKRYDEVANMLFNMAIEEHHAGDVVAMHGFCMGFQMMMRFSAVAGDNILSRGFDASEQPNELMWTVNADTSRLVGDLPIDNTGDHISNAQYLRLRMSQVPPVVIENHHEGVNLEDFLADEALLDMWKLLSVSKDRIGRQYVSTVEAKNYLFSGTQWHPEKNAFEWKSPSIPHQVDAIAVTQFMANRFVNQAKFSKHRAATQERMDELSIWNTPPIFHSPLVRDFELIFVYGPHDQALLRETTINPPRRVRKRVNELYRKQFS